MWSGSAGNVIYCENLSRRQKNILNAAAKAAFGRSLSHLYCGWIRTTSKWRSYERWLNNFRIFRVLITESRSHFERSETVKGFTEVAQRRWRAELCRTRSLNDRTPTGRGRLFALVADKLDLFSAERRLEKEKCSFYCVLYNKSIYVMGLKDSNASRQLSPTVHLPFYFNFHRSWHLCNLPSA